MHVVRYCSYIPSFDFLSEAEVSQLRAALRGEDASELGHMRIELHLQEASSPALGGLGGPMPELYPGTATPASGDT